MSGWLLGARVVITEAVSLCLVGAEEDLTWVIGKRIDHFLPALKNRGLHHFSALLAESFKKKNINGLSGSGTSGTKAWHG